MGKKLPFVVHYDMWPCLALHGFVWPWIFFVVLNSILYLYIGKILYSYIVSWLHTPFLAVIDPNSFGLVIYILDYCKILIVPTKMSHWMLAISTHKIDQFSKSLIFLNNLEPYLSNEWSYIFVPWLYVVNLGFWKVQKIYHFWSSQLILEKFAKVLFFAL